MSMEHQTFGVYEAQWIQNDEANKSTVLGLSFMVRALMEFRNSSHIICHILSAQIINRRAKNMTLILLTRTTETLKTCACACTRAHTHRKQPLCWASFTLREYSFRPWVLSQLKTPKRWGVGEMGEGSQRHKLAVIKWMSWGCIVQHSDYNE